MLSEDLSLSLKLLSANRVKTTCFPFELSFYSFCIVHFLTPLAELVNIWCDFASPVNVSVFKNVEICVCVCVCVWWAADPTAAAAAAAAGGAHGSDAGILSQPYGCHRRRSDAADSSFQRQRPGGCTHDAVFRYTHARTHTHSYSLSHTHTHTHTHTHSYSLTHTHTHMHTHTHTHMHTHTHAHTHTHTHSLSHTHTHTHTYSLSHTHAHTHTLILSHTTRLV